MAIDLEKGAKIDLSKEEPGLAIVRVGTLWTPVGAKCVERKTEVKEKKTGFLSTLGSVLKGEARIGDAVNSAVDGTKDVFNNIVDGTTNRRYETPPIGEEIDVDTSAVLLVNDQYISSEDKIYFGHREFMGRRDIVLHMGDDTTGRDKQGIKADNESIIIDLTKVPTKYNRITIISNIFNARSKGQHFGMIAEARVRIINNENENVIATYNPNEDYSGYAGMVVGSFYRHNGNWKFETSGTPTKASDIDSIIRESI